MSLTSDQRIDPDPDLPHTPSMPGDGLRDRSGYDLGTGLLGKLLRLLERLSARAAHSDSESKWSVYTGEGRATAAGNEWIQNIDVERLLRRPVARAAFAATVVINNKREATGEAGEAALLEEYRRQLRRIQDEERANRPST
ncbi:hypothetical protein ABTZ99_27505 [Actinosynnema sp. NPDC002837]